MTPLPLKIDIHVPRILLLSLHPVYAKRFFEQTKRVELRRTRPRLSEGDFVLFYVTAPEQAIGGGGRVKRVLELSPNDLWLKIGKLAGIDRASFDHYFENCALGYGILFDEVWSFDPTIQRSSIERRWPNFRPPQLYKYLTEADVKRLGVRVHDRCLGPSEDALHKDRLPRMASVAGVGG